MWDSKWLASPRVKFLFFIKQRSKFGEAILMVATEPRVTWPQPRTCRALSGPAKTRARGIRSMARHNRRDGRCGPQFSMFPCVMSSYPWYWCNPWFDLLSSGEQAADVGGSDERHSTTDCTNTTDKRIQIIEGADPRSELASRGAEIRLTARRANPFRSIGTRAPTFRAMGLISS